MTNKTFATWITKGIFPLTNESEELFLNRAVFVSSLEKEFSASFEKVSDNQWRPVLEKLKKIWGFSPDWLVAYYSNTNLTLWQGAATWIYEKEGKTFPLIQIRKNFKKGRFLFYWRDEILLHETLHAMRFPFKKSRYEEIFAYFLADRKWRAFLGPLFRSPLQALFFVSLLVFSFVSQIFWLFYPFIFFGFVFYLPFLYLAWRLALLIRDRYFLKRALRSIAFLFPKLKNPMPAALLLTDREIDILALSSKKKLGKYIQSKVSSSLRWKAIQECL